MDTQTLHWLPDPTKGDDGNFKSLQELIGTETNDKDRPGITVKGTLTETDKKNKAHLNACEYSIQYFYINKNIVVFPTPRIGDFNKCFLSEFGFPTMHKQHKHALSYKKNIVEKSKFKVTV